MWRYGQTRKNGKAPKVPYRPQDGATFDGAGALVPGAGGTLSQALAALRRYSHRYDGIGIILGAGLVGVDFDHCIDGTGQLAPAVAGDLAALGTYAEVSPSGEGVKALCLGELPSSWKAGYCEGYGQDRFFTLTFRQLRGTPDAITPGCDALAALHDRWASKGATPTRQGPGGTGSRRGALLRLNLDWSFVAWLEARPLRLLSPSGLPYGCTPQLRALLERGELPANLLAKAQGENKSECRALVVRQLARAGYLREEVYVLAWKLWERLRCDTKRPGELLDDLGVLIAAEEQRKDYTPSTHSLKRRADYQKTPTPAPAAPPAEALAERAPRRAPTSPAAYLEVMQEVAVSGVVLEGRSERAALAGIHEKTAQRLEARLVAEGAIRVKNVRTDTGRKSVVQILKRIIGPVAADVQIPPFEPVVTPQIEAAPANAIGEDTGCPLEPLVGELAAPEPAPVEARPDPAPPTPNPVSSPSSRPAAPTLRELVADALDAYGTQGGAAVLARVCKHVRTVGGLRCSDAAIKRACDAELERRKHARADAALAARAEQMNPGQRRRRLRNLERNIADDLALAALLRRQPYLLDPITGEPTTERRSELRPETLEARVWVWARQYAIIARVHEGALLAALDEQAEEAALLALTNEVLARGCVAVQGTPYEHPSVQAPTNPRRVVVARRRVQVGRQVEPELAPADDRPGYTAAEADAWLMAHGWRRGPDGDWIAPSLVMCAD